MASLSTRRAMLIPGAVAGLPRLIAAIPATGTRGEVTVARRAMGCEFSVVFPAGFRRAWDAGCHALDVVDSLEEELSVFRPESDLSILNRRAALAPVEAAPGLYNLLRKAARISRDTGGAFDAASGALVRAWGYTCGPKRVPGDTERLAALRASGSTQVVFDDKTRSIRFLRERLEFNLGAFGKGHAIDCALDATGARFGTRPVLMQAGQSSFKAIGAPEGESRGWMIAIDDPTAQGRAVALVRLRNRALGTSGVSHQFFESGGRRFGHILDPRTGWPADLVAGASAIADSAADADALSTAFFVMGAEGARRYCQDHPRVGAVIILKPKPQAAPEVLLFGAATTEVTS